MLDLYRFYLPVLANDGATSYHEALDIWKHEAIKLAGGITICALVRGAWIDPATGTVYDETIQPFEVACDHSQYCILRDRAFDLFPDQLAIMAAEIGTAYITSRK